MTVIVLLKRRSQINQQIALKTIKKFGFSVNAVWNGQEALDYLLEPDAVARPKPDIILMDIQMPILDGYRATHIIRHHKPYVNIVGIRNLPIVAMTASAIQGDKEKTVRAGMDDYLAKPVRGKTLEAMLLKWAREGKNEGRLDQQQWQIHDDSSCNGTDTGSVASAHPANDGEHDPDNAAASTALPTTENKSDIGMEQGDAEDKATLLRDNKLLAASEKNPYPITTPPNGPSHRPNPALAALTEENMTRLDRQLGQEAATAAEPVDSLDHFRSPLAEGGGEGGSSAATSPDSSRSFETAGSLAGPKKLAIGSMAGALELSTRGQLKRGESERTVTLGNREDGRPI